MTLNVAVEKVAPLKTMKPVNEIYAEFLLGRVRFHLREETDTFHASLMSFIDTKYSASATLAASLYERIFTTRLIRETANPPGFVPSEDNLALQLQNLRDRENEVINVDRMSFRDITKRLVALGILTSAEKKEYDTFYTEVRNPVAHGLTARLFERLQGRAPSHPFEVDAAYETVYRNAAHMLLDRIFHLMAVKVLRKE